MSIHQSLNMITVAEAEKIILSNTRDYGTIHTPFQNALGSILAEHLYADRDLPPFNRVTMDGIAIKFDVFETGKRSYNIASTQAAGETPIIITDPDACIEIMTGAAMPPNLDTIIRYEDLQIENGIATITTEKIKKGQNVHLAGSDKQQGSSLVAPYQRITPAIIGIAASVGKTQLLVKKLPKVVIIATGDELVDITDTPNSYQIRRSNNYTIQAVLQQYGLQPAMLHIADNLEATKTILEQCLAEYDVILLSGGISMGKYDYIPKALEALNVKQLFHKVNQRPGKPFWFGTYNDSQLVFAFPGNPVSTFLGLLRYFIPWLKTSLGLPLTQNYAMLAEDVSFKPNLQYFLQVIISTTQTGQLIAQPLSGNGSGDFLNLVAANAFMELPADTENFFKGEVYSFISF